MTNIALESIMTRTSVRSFTDAHISDQLLDTVLKAAMAAPSAMNKQPWHFFVIRGEKLRDSIADHLEYGRQSLRGADLAVVVAGDTTRFFEDPEAVDYWIEDCSAAAENLLLAAHSVGLGAVWCGVYPIASRMAQLREATGIPDRYIPLCIIPMGYPAETPAPKDKWDPEKVTRLD